MNKYFIFFEAGTEFGNFTMSLPFTRQVATFMSTKLYYRAQRLKSGSHDYNMTWSTKDTCVAIDNSNAPTQWKNCNSASTVGFVTEMVHDLLTASSQKPGCLCLDTSSFKTKHWTECFPSCCVDVFSHYDTSKYTYLTHTDTLLTISVDESPSFEADSPKLAKNYPAFYAPRSFIIAFTKRRHRSRIWVK
jgi:hypothetical protein